LNKTFFNSLLTPEEVVARALAKGVVRDGLRLSSTDLRWVRGKASALALDGAV
jgi:hypothetical protein